MKGGCMKKLTKKILITFTFLMTSLLLTNNVKAASASISVSSNNQVNIDSTFTVTVTVRSTGTLGSWEYHLGYDSNRLTLVSGDKDVVGYGDATKKTQSYTYKFKAKATGSAKIEIGSASVVDWISEKEIATSKGSKTVQIVKPTPSKDEPDKPVKSHNSYLKSLVVSEGNLSPEFTKDQHTYSLLLNKDVQNIEITAVTEDSKARIGGDGNISVKEGDNKIEVKVTAEDGDIRTYTINAYVEEKNPTIIKIDKNEYTVVKKSSFLNVPDGFNEEEFELMGKKVPSFLSDNKKVRLLGIKDNDDNYLFAIIDGDDYLIYEPITIGNLPLLKLPYPKDLIPEGYSLDIFKLEQGTIEVYKKNKNDAFSLIYAMNLNTGKKSLYQIDEEELTIQRYAKTVIKTADKTSIKSSIVVLSSAFSFVVAAIYAAIRNSKK